MNRVYLLIIFIVTVLPLAAVVANDSVVIDKVVQNGVTVGGGKVIAGLPVTLSVRLNVETDMIPGLNNAFAIYSTRNGVYTDSFDPAAGYWLPGSYFEEPNRFVNSLSCDGAGRDTVRFSGFALGIGIPIGVRRCFSITTGNFVAGDTLGVDSVSTLSSPNDLWLWSTNSGDIFPDWPGPYAFPVVDCCAFAGDCDFDGQFTVTDLVIMGRFFFRPGTTLLCDEVVNVDGSTGLNPLTVADITYMINFLFKGGPPPVACE